MATGADQDVGHDRGRPPGRHGRSRLSRGAPRHLPVARRRRPVPRTVFPDGATIDHPRLLTRPISSSVADALAGHRTALAEWTSRPARPLVVRTLQDYREVEAELRERTGGLRIADHLEQFVEAGAPSWAIFDHRADRDSSSLVILTAIRGQA